MKKTSAVDSYESTRVFLSKSGEIVLALPIYADETNNVILNSSEINSITGLPNLSFGVYDHIGYVMYNPELGEFIMNRNALDLFEDLGKL